jgi:serine phosphatase RsbU (regulator of sigma subunit)
MRRTSHTHPLAPGDTVLLYTDGLIERPAASLDEGQQSLLAAAALHRDNPLPELLRRLQDLSDKRDDTALLAFRADPGTSGNDSAGQTAARPCTR